MIWMLALCCFVTVYLSYALRTQKRQGLLVTGIVAIVTLSGSFYLYWNLGAYEMSLSTQALIDLPANERAHVIAQAAQDEFLANNRVADPNVIELLNLALDLDPDQITALGTLGIIAFESKEFARAESYWSHMLSQLPEGSEEAGAISEGISRAREQAVRILPEVGARRIVGGR